MVACVVGLVLLGRWQWHRAHESDGTMQNVLYAVQWVFFAGFVVFLWWKLLREELHPATARAARAARQVHQAEPAGSGAAPALPEEQDDELIAYNRYLAELATRSSRPRRSG